MNIYYPLKFDHIDINNEVSINLPSLTLTANDFLYIGALLGNLGLIPIYTATRQGKSSIQMDIELEPTTVENAKNSLNYILNSVLKGHDWKFKVFNADGTFAYKRMSYSDMQNILSDLISEG